MTTCACSWRVGTPIVSMGMERLPLLQLSKLSIKSSELPERQRLQNFSSHYPQEKRPAQEYIEKSKRRLCSGSSWRWDLWWQRFPELSKANSTRLKWWWTNRDQRGHPLASLWFDWSSLRIADGYVVIDTMDGRNCSFRSIMLVQSVALPFWIRARLFSFNAPLDLVQTVMGWVLS